VKIIDGILYTTGRSGRTLWISHNVLTGIGISSRYLREARYLYKQSLPPSQRSYPVLPNNGRAWRWMRRNGRFYYAFDNIPDRAPNFWRSRLPKNPANEAIESIERKLNEQLLGYLPRASEIYQSQYLHYSSKQQKKLSLAAAFVEFAYLKWKENDRDGHIISILADLAARHKLQYIPYHPRRLKEKLQLLDEGIPVIDIIQPPRLGNSFARIYDDPEVESWVIQLRRMGQNYTNEYIIRKVSEMCRLTGKRVPSRRWFGQKILENHETKYLTINRFGKGTRGSQMYEGYIPIKNALFAGDAWQVDATRVNLIAHNSGGKQAFLFVIAVRDVHSGDILGYHFDYKEDRWSVLNAVKMAVINAGYLPYEIVFDRFPGHNTPEAKEFFDHLRHLHTKITFTHKATGKARLERWFGTLQTVFMQESDYYYGQGVQSTRKYAHRSPDYLKKIRKDAYKIGFDFIAAVEESTKIIEAYRNTPYSYYSRKHKDLNKPPRLLHAESDKPNVHWVDDITLSMLFGHKKEVSIKRGGIIKTQIYKQEYYYRIDNFEIIKQYPKVWISYDLENLSKVYLFIRRGSLWMNIGQAELLEPVQIYGPQAEFNRLAKEKQRIKNLEQARNELLAKKTAMADEVELLMGRYTQKLLKETSENLLISGDDTKISPHPPDIDILSIRNKY